MGSFLDAPVSGGFAMKSGGTNTWWVVAGGSDTLGPIWDCIGTIMFGRGWVGTEKISSSRFVTSNGFSNMMSNASDLSLTENTPNILWRSKISSESKGVLTGESAILKDKLSPNLTVSLALKI